MSGLPPSVIQDPSPPPNPEIGTVWAFPIPPALRYYDGTAWRQTDRWVPAIPPIIAIPFWGNYASGIWYRGFSQLGNLVAFNR